MTRASTGVARSHAQRTAQRTAAAAAALLLLLLPAAAAMTAARAAEHKVRAPPQRAAAPSDGQLLLALKARFSRPRNTVGAGANSTKSSAPLRLDSWKGADPCAGGGWAGVKCAGGRVTGM